jgi:hypothetical protein
MNSSLSSVSPAMNTCTFTVISQNKNKIKRLQEKNQKRDGNRLGKRKTKERIMGKIMVPKT